MLSVDDNVSSAAIVEPAQTLDDNSTTDAAATMVWMDADGLELAEPSMDVEPADAEANQSPIGTDSDNIEIGEISWTTEQPGETLDIWRVPPKAARESSIRSSTSPTPAKARNEYPGASPAACGVANKCRRKCG